MESFFPTTAPTSLQSLNYADFTLQYFVTSNLLPRLY